MTCVMHAMSQSDTKNRETHLLRVGLDEDMAEIKEFIINQTNYNFGQLLLNE